MSRKEVDTLRAEVFQDEACLVGLFWQYPEFYVLYSNDKVSTKSFLNPIWQFYFGVGRTLADKGLQVFDDIVTFRAVKECGKEDTFKEFNGYTTIKEIMDEVKDSKDNFEGYFQQVRKYSVIKDLIGLMGMRVVAQEGKYNYRVMSADQIYLYWLDKMNQIVKDIDNKYDESFLLQGIEESIRLWDEQPSIGLPYYQSKHLTKITTGWDYGNVYIHGGFSGKGKTSLTVNKVVMSCIEHKEKLLVIANEQSIEEFKKLLLVTAMGVGTRDGFNRQRLQEGKFTDEERTKLRKAAEWLKNLCDNEKTILFVFMESYTIDNIRKVLTHYANRGYRRVIIDTGKPGDNAGDTQRWERFADDMKEIYKMSRPNAGGLNLAIWVNVQLADSARNQRFLDEFALADSKKIKNEASVLFLGRHIWDDEYEGKKNALRVYKFVGSDFGDGYMKEEFWLDEYRTDTEGRSWKNHYYLLFTPKNRRGQSNDTGLDVLVLRVNHAFNTWSEVGWTSIANNRS